MNSDEISNAIVAKTKEIIVEKDALNIVMTELYENKKRGVELAEFIRKAKHNISRMKDEKEILEREYWKSRNG